MRRAFPAAASCLFLTTTPTPLKRQRCINCELRGRHAIATLPDSCILWYAPCVSVGLPQGDQLQSKNGEPKGFPKGVLRRDGSGDRVSPSLSSIQHHVCMSDVFHQAAFIIHSQTIHGSSNRIFRSEVSGGLLHDSGWPTSSITLTRIYGGSRRGI